MDIILQTVSRINSAVKRGSGLAYELNRGGIAPDDWDEYNGDKEGTCEALVKKQGKDFKKGGADSMPKAVSK